MATSAGVDIGRNPGFSRRMLYDAGGRGILRSPVLEVLPTWISSTRTITSGCPVRSRIPPIWLCAPATGIREEAQKAGGFGLSKVRSVMVFFAKYRFQKA